MTELCGFVPKFLPLYQLVATLNSPTRYAQLAANVSVWEGLVVGMREIGQILIAAKKCSFAGTSLYCYDTKKTQI